MTSPGQSAPMVPHYPLHNYYRYANYVVRCIALGERLVRTGRELADLQDVVTLFIGSIGTSLVDWFPELDQLPLVLTAMVKALGEAWRLERRGLQVMVDSGTREGREGDSTPFMDSGRFLHPDTKFTGNDQEAMYVAMQFLEPRSDTTREVLNIFAMTALC